METPTTDPSSEFVSLLTEHQLAIRLYVRSLMPGDSEAADIAQQTNSTLWRKREDFTLGTNFKAWAFTVARYEVLTHRKKQARDARRLVFSDELENMIAEEMPRESGDLERRQDALRHCLSKLREIDRALILHRYFRQQPLQTFAEEHGRSPGGLRVALHRIRNTLQKCIEGSLDSLPTSSSSA